MDLDEKRIERRLEEPNYRKGMLILDEKRIESVPAPVIAVMAFISGSMKRGLKVFLLKLYSTLLEL